MKNERNLSGKAGQIESENEVILQKLPFRIVEVSSNYFKYLKKIIKIP
jgi:hypothetical protein